MPLPKNTISDLRSYLETQKKTFAFYLTEDENTPVLPKIDDLIDYCKKMEGNNSAGMEAGLQGKIPEFLETCVMSKNGVPGKAQKGYFAFLDNVAKELNGYADQIVLPQDFDAGRKPEEQSGKLNEMLFSLWGTRGMDQERTMIRKRTGETLPIGADIAKILHEGDPQLAILTPRDGLPHNLTLDKETGRFHISWEVSQRPPLPEKPFFLKRMFNFIFHFQDVAEYDQAVTRQKAYDSYEKSGAVMKEEKQADDRRAAEAGAAALKEKKDAEVKAQEDEEKQRVDALCQERAEKYLAYAARVDTKMAKKDRSFNNLGELAKTGAKILYGDAPDSMICKEDDKTVMAMARLIAFEMEAEKPGTISNEKPNEDIQKICKVLVFRGMLDVFLTEEGAFTRELDINKIDAFLSGENQKFRENFQDIADIIHGQQELVEKDKPDPAEPVLEDDDAQLNQSQDSADALLDQFQDSFDALNNSGMGMHF